MVELAHSLSLRNFPEAHTNTMPQLPGQHGLVSLCFKSTCSCVCAYRHVHGCMVSRAWRPWLLVGG